MADLTEEMKNLIKFYREEASKTADHMQGLK